MKKIFIDCSFLSYNPTLNTGIQRVVRKIVENLIDIAKENNIQLHLVDIDKHKFDIVDFERLELAETIGKKNIQKIAHFNVLNYLKNIFNALKMLMVAFIPLHSFQRFMLSSRHEFGLNYLIFKFIINPIKSIRLFFARRQIVASTLENKKILIADGDLLLLLDSTWHLDIWPSVVDAQKSGAKIISVIYDLIPITNPEFCDDYLVDVFKNWFYKSTKYVDEYICISSTVKNELSSYLFNEYGVEILSKKLDYFLLGGDINRQSTQNLTIRDDLINVFSDCNVYLIVSTIEPRKNHSYLLDVFDLLWQAEVDVKMCIVGRIGWKVDELMNRIFYASQFNKKLFCFNDLNDLELGYCYQNSKSLLFPSYVEGFGLPIIEALSNRLPVLASDIPIHREVGGDKIGYFDITNPKDLKNKIFSIETNGIPSELIPNGDYSWMTWRQSAEMLFAKINR